MQTKKPLIGIVPDYREGSEKGYSVRNYYALRANHVEMINQAGGAAVILTYDYDLIDSYLDAIDGLMIVGGYFDINPKRYGDEEIHESVKLNEVRENFEEAIVSKALKSNLPYFGICNGMQLLNVLNGGKVIQHIPDEENFINHEQSHIAGFNNYETAYHDILIEKSSRLFAIIGQEKIKTNSSHHQAAKHVGRGLNICARAEDGIIEAIENPNHPFCLGVQWHPEFNCSKADEKLFIEFVKAAQNFKKLK
jgi:putative glutamine amidotransferase